MNMLALSWLLERVNRTKSSVHIMKTVVSLINKEGNDYDFTTGTEANNF
jgi:hypothetical protein